jgi:hypothetical protein
MLPRYSWTLACCAARHAVLAMEVPLLAEYMAWVFPSFNEVEEGSRWLLSSSGEEKVRQKLLRVASTFGSDVPTLLHQPCAAPCCRTVQLLLSIEPVRVPAMHANERHH